MKREYRLFLKDIVAAIGKIEEFIAGMDFDEFVTDDRTASAVIRKLEIIGEASKNIPDSIKRKYEVLPWKDMSRMRDKMSHAYFGVDYEIVWRVITERLPEIKPVISEILGEAKGAKR
ncbi:MAG: DUF86 domain-containing protein [Actinobacteria bacterium]|nr:DUF86 domain-containing protein [Actinomycetota bacterium]